MQITATKIPDVKIIEPLVFADERGYFSETFNAKKFNEALGKKKGEEIDFIQDNESFSQKNTLRGLHYQLPPFAQSKLVRVTQGRVLDVAVDIRRNSQTFGEYVGVELTAENKKQLFIPQGFAHAFLVLSETAKFSYKVDNYYSPEHDRGILFSDPEISGGKGIDWGVLTEDLIVSEKDKNQTLLKNAYIFEG